MITLIIAVLIGGVSSWWIGRDLQSPVWGVVCGLAIVVLVQIAISLLLRRGINRINQRIQEVMTAAQQRINRQAQRFQQRPGGDPRRMQQLLEKEQADAIRQAIEISGEAKRFYKWNFMLKRQMQSMQMLLYFQLRDFEKVDELMKHALIFDPRSTAVKLVRLYRRNDPQLDKFYRRKCRRFKGDDRALLACTYAWMQLRRDDPEGALQTLVEAKKVTDHPAVVENWDRLANGKAKHFSNAALGDNWYSLYLETPKIKPQRVQQRPY